MVLNIIVTALSVIGIYGFYNDNMLLLYIGAIAVIIEAIIGIANGELKSIYTYVIAIVIGYICTHNFLTGGAIGLCFESVILSLLGWIVFFIMAVRVISEEKQHVVSSVAKPTSLNQKNSSINDNLFYIILAGIILIILAIAFICKFI